MYDTIEASTVGIMNNVEITSYKEGNIAFVKAIGQVNQIREYLEIQKEYYSAVAKHNTFTAIIDIRNLKFPEGVADQLKIVDFVDNDPHFEEARLFKVAVLYGDQDREIAGFWETYAVNKGFNFKTFLVKSDALTWLES